MICTKQQRPSSSIYSSGGLRHFDDPARNHQMEKKNVDDDERLSFDRPIVSKASGAVTCQAAASEALGHVHHVHRLGPKEAKPDSWI